MIRLKALALYSKNLLKYMRQGGVVYSPVSFLKADERFVGKTVLVTGATSGIGFEIAKEMLAEGANVIITGRRENKLQEAVQALGGGKKLTSLLWNIADVSIAKSKLQEAVQFYGSIDIIVNNAGVYDHLDWRECTEELYDKVVDTNAKALYFMCQAEGNYFESSGHKGKIINICSRNSIDAFNDPYTISKWGAACITKGLAKELVEKGVIINGVAPGNVSTNIHGDNTSKDMNYNAYMPSHLTKRWVLVEEVASLVLFLSSDSANNIVGQIIAVYGGWTLH